jgi:hypothetical protein
VTIREYAARREHEVVGKLTRRPEWERRSGERWYIDEAGNEYMSYHGFFMILTPDGCVM